MTKTKITWECGAANTCDGEPYHFFASSMAEWKVSEDLDKLIRDMKRAGFPFNIWKVPAPLSAAYKIEYYTPQVEGAQHITSFRQR